jgi:hypothetical protein
MKLECVTGIREGQSENVKGKPLGRSRSIRENNIKKKLKNIEGNGLLSSGSAQSPVNGSCGHGNKPHAFMRSGEFLD